MLPNWLFQIIFWGVILFPFIWIAAALTGWAAFVDKATREPKAPPHVDTPVEAIARKQHDLKMLAELLQIRQNAQNH